ncbi:hypothetical protein KI387_041995, partial [Taxus chinensis]
VKEENSRVEEAKNDKKITWEDDEETQHSMTVMGDPSTNKTSGSDDKSKKKEDKSSASDEELLPQDVLEKVYEMQHTCLSGTQSESEGLGDE